MTGAKHMGALLPACLFVFPVFLASHGCGDAGGESPPDVQGDDAPAGDTADPQDSPQEPQPCSADNDGLLERSEILFVAGASVEYTMNAPGTTVTIDLTPGTGTEGEPLWDFSRPQSERVTLTYQGVAGQWFQAEFPAAGYALPVSPGSGVLGVYSLTETDISLLGIVSVEEGRTLMKYASPVPILRFPMGEGDAWVVTSRIEGGIFEGNPYTSEDTYRVEAVRMGTVNLGYIEMRGSLQVRITTVQRFPGGTQRASIQYVWMHECYGEIVRVRSLDGETDPDFTQAGEVRILAL